MYYGYNTFTGRLVGANRMAAYMPQGLQQLGPSEPANPYPPNFKKPAPSTPATQTVARAAHGFAAHGQQEHGKVSERILRIRETMQKNSHLPVHLKGGTKDYVLYYATIGLAVIGVAMVIRNTYNMIYPKKSN